MSIESLLARYGLLALFVGAGVEGETVVVTGGLMAHRGLVTLPAAIAAAAAGSFVADQLFFALGRRFRDHPRVRRVARRPAFARALALLERYPTGFIFAFRFLYGLRTISPIAIGTTGVSTARFMAINAVAAAVWAALFTTLGFLFGHAIAGVFGRLFQQHALWIGGAVIAALAIGAWWYRRVRTAS